MNKQALVPSNDRYILHPSERPGWLVYPRAYYRIVEQGLVNIMPWHFLEAQQTIAHFQGLANRYPTRELFPFAYRQDNDDLACWSKGTGDKVFIVHDFASEGWENSGEFENTWSWFRDAIEETIGWD